MEVKKGPNPLSTKCQHSFSMDTVICNLDNVKLITQISEWLISV